MIRCHHQLNGHELEQTLGESGGQRNLACCNPWGCRKSDTAEHQQIPEQHLQTSWEGDRLQKTIGHWEVVRKDLITAWGAEGREFEAT